MDGDTYHCATEGRILRTARAAIACFTYSAVVLILLHVLRPDYTPVNHMISDYAVGSYGWVMVSFFVAMSAGLLMLAAGLMRNGPRSPGARLALVLLAIASIGLLVSAAFPTDIEGAPSTRAGDIHALSFLVNVVSIIVAIVLLSISFGSDSRWRTLRGSALTLSALILMAFVFQAYTLFNPGPHGVANRLFITLLLAWLFSTAFRLRATEGRL